jgi:glucokinase
MVLGVDIGGSHITATLVNLEIESIIKSSEVREPVNAKGTATEIITQWSSVIKRAFDKQNIPVSNIGIAMPGPFDYNKGIAWIKNQDKYNALYGLNVKELLAESLNVPSQNIRFLNDAESFLKGEAFSGAAKGTSKAIGLTLGTGLGSARYIYGNVEDADLWHSPFLNGIAEDYLSTRWFIAKYLELTGKKVNGVKELSALANEDNAALKTFEEFGYNLAHFLTDVIKKDEPDIVVLGGNIAHAFNLFSKELNKQLDNLIYIPTIKKALLGEEASLIGAASCWAVVEEQIQLTARA